MLLIRFYFKSDVNVAPKYLNGVFSPIENDLQVVNDFPTTLRNNYHLVLQVSVRKNRAGPSSQKVGLGTMEKYAVQPVPIVLAVDPIAWNGSGRKDPPLAQYNK